MTSDRADHAAAALPTTVRSAATLTDRGDHLLPTATALQPLLPDGGLRRGTTVGVTGIGATSLSFALMAEVTATGGWCAAVGFDALGVLAAAEAGVALERLVLVCDPGAAWPTIVAALLDAFEIVLLRPATRASGSLQRRLAARLRERQRVLLVADAAGGVPVDVTLTGSTGVWEGLGWGTGHLRSRQLRVRADGRRLGGRPRHTTVWLPDPQGRVTPARPVRAPRPQRVESVA